MLYEYFIELIFMIKKMIHPLLKTKYEPLSSGIIWDSCSTINFFESIYEKIVRNERFSS